MKESLCHIVGVQFRNCATVGGSIYGRYGFSDVLTMFLGMDTWVELYDAGRIPLTEFVNMKKDNDILVNIIVRKEPLLTCYLSQRNIKTDFPVLTCAASVIGNEARTVIGARPARAMIVEDKKQILKNFRNMTKKAEGRGDRSLCRICGRERSYCRQYARIKGIQNPSCKSTDKKSLGSSRRDEK